LSPTDHRKRRRDADAINAPSDSQLSNKMLSLPKHSGERPNTLAPQLFLVLNEALMKGEARLKFASALCLLGTMRGAILNRGLMRFAARRARAACRSARRRSRQPRARIAANASHFREIPGFYRSRSLPIAELRGAICGWEQRIDLMSCGASPDAASAACDCPTHRPFARAPI
jgi:hypothetical protein